MKRFASVLVFVAACGIREDDASSSASALSESGAILALGDSITYGYDPGLTPEGAPFDRYHGYAELLANGAPVVNASCIGETSASFLDASAGGSCHEGRDGEAFTSWLKTPWNAKTQKEFVVHFLGSNNPQLIVLTLGGNDMFAALEECGGGVGCVGSIPGAAREYGERMHEIFAAIGAAGYTGKVVVPTTYALDYGEWLKNQGIGLYNSALESAASSANDDLRQRGSSMQVLVADVYEAFSKAAKGGSSCDAGLLLPAARRDDRQNDRERESECDIHPSAKGHALIADTIRGALR